MNKKSSSDTKPLGVQKWDRRLSTRRAIAIMAFSSILLLVLAVGGAWYFFKLYQDTSGIASELKPPTSLSELIEEYPQLSSILEDTSLDSVYKEFLIAYEEGGQEAAYELARKRGLLSDNDELRLSLELDTTETDQLVSEFEARGIRVTAVSENFMDIAIPLDLLNESIESDQPGSMFLSITGIEHIVRVRPPIIRFQDSAPMNIESLGLIGAEDWHNAGFSGQGVTVGILDGGFDGYRALLGNELPADVVVHSFIYGVAADQTGTVHGTACAEIVHDIAPAAKLYLVASETKAEFEQAVDWMISEGVDIITHSGSWLYGPKDGTGPGTYAVKQAVADGVFWVNSAGNYADKHYRGFFTDQDGDGFHEFSAGDEMMWFDPDGAVKFVLNWDDWKVGDQDIDLFIVDADTNEIASSQNVQAGPNDSMEYVYYEFTDSGPYYIAFYGSRVTKEILFDFFIYGSEIEYFTKEYSLGSPGDALEAFTIGAIYWEDGSLEPFSSQGPTNNEFLKPDLSAPDGTYSVAYGRAFYGTSASTPHVAGAAALVRDAFPDFGPQEIADFLRERAIDTGPSGPDNIFGYGRLHLGAAPAFGVLPTLPVLEPTLLPSATLVPSELAPPSAVPTLALTPTNSLFSAPTPEPENDTGSSNLVLSFLACVLMPGVLGLSGIGILGAVLIKRHSRSSRKLYYRAQIPARSYPPLPPSPDPQRVVQNICPRCGSPHRQAARFCPICGYTLDLGAPDYQIKAHCIYCGQPLRLNSKFCPHCGERVP